MNELCPHCGEELDPLEAFDQCEHCGEEVGREQTGPEIDNGELQNSRAGKQRRQERWDRIPTHVWQLIGALAGEGLMWMDYPERFRARLLDGWRSEQQVNDEIGEVADELIEAIGAVLVDFPDPDDYLDDEAEAQHSARMTDNLGGYQGPVELRPGGER